MTLVRTGCIIRFDIPDKDSEIPEKIVKLNLIKKSFENLPVKLGNLRQIRKLPRVIREGFVYLWF